jgi:Zn-dependent alcohol dehydrogenase
MRTTIAVQRQVNGPLELEEIELPRLRDDQVLIDLKAAGLCLSQVHEMRSADFERPRGMGHEAVGVVLEAGGDVTHVKAGDLAVLTWVPRSPIKGRKQVEVTGATVGGETLHGPYWGWGKLLVARAEFVIPVPADSPLDISAVVGCGVMTGAGAVKNTAQVKAGDSVAIYGVGGVGSSAVMMAAALGADPVIAVDISDDKLEFAKSIGATHGVNAAKTDPVKAIIEITGGGADFAFDTVGARQAAESIVPSVRGGGPGSGNTGGTAVLVGNPEPEITIKPSWFVGHQRRLVGSHGAMDPRTDIEYFLRMRREGMMPLDRLVTRRYRLEQVNEAARNLAEGKILGRAIFDLAD